MSLLSKAKSVVSKVASTVKKVVKNIGSSVKAQPASVAQYPKITTPKISAPNLSKVASTAKTILNKASTATKSVNVPTISGSVGGQTLIPKNTGINSPKSGPMSIAPSSGGMTLVPTKNMSIAPSKTSNKGGTASSKLTSPSVPNTFNAESFDNAPASFNVPLALGASGGGASGLSVNNGIGAYLGASAGTTANPASNLGINAYNPLGSYEEEVRRREKEKDKAQKDLIKMMNAFGEKGAEATRLGEEAGIPQIESEIRDLQAKQSAETAQYLSQIENIQNKPIAMEFIAGQQGEVQRRYGIDALITSSLLQAKSGQLQTAQATVDRAISLKYDPLEARIETQKQILEFNYDNLSRADKKLADARLEVLDQQKETMQQFKDIQTETVKTALANGAPSDVISAIMHANSIEEIGKIGGQFAPAGTFMDFGTSTSGFTPTQQSNFAKIPDNLKTSVLDLVNGDALLSDLVKSRGIQGTQQIQQLISYAQAIDPNYSVNTEKIRYAFKQAWNTDNVKGAVGSQTAINTALGHLADLAEASRALPATVLNKMNSVKNVLSKEFGDPSVTNFRIVLNALGAELARVYKGGVPNEGEIEDWKNSLASSFSQSQLNGAFNTTSKLLSSKLTALRYKYLTTMGREYDQSLVDPDKREALIRAGINPDFIIKENLPTSVAGTNLVDGFSETW